jgi:hypothetical protein
VICRETIMNQTNIFVLSAVNRRSVTANAVLVHDKAVKVTVALEDKRIMNLARLLISRSQLCRPSLNSLTRICVMMSVAMMVN